MKKQQPSSKNVVFLQLNELNFDLVKKYIDSGVNLPGFQQVLNWNKAITNSEDKYELLEPWIQWVSIHSGLDYREHKVFRLGDVVNSSFNNIFEVIERRGYSVGAVSPMNLECRLAEPSFFIPDPWTNSKTDGSWTSEFLSVAVSQLVNDNASGKITLKTIAKLLAVSIYMINPLVLLKIFKKFITSRNGKKWRKVLAFDYFLTTIFLRLLKKKKPNFSVLFLNGCAHIQHHYMLSSPFVGELGVNQNPKWYVNTGYDPVLDMVKEYDDIISLVIKNNSVIIATALTQKPCSETVFYYRLKDHSGFLDRLGLKYKYVEPRMSRDFLVHFESDEHRDQAFKALDELLINGDRKLFGQIDRRSCSLFVTLDYPHEISNISVLTNMPTYNLSNELALVAIKNGEHHDVGYVYASADLPKVDYLDGKHCKNIFEYFRSMFP